MNYLDLTITDIHQALLEKKVTPLDLVVEAISRLKNDDNNAVEYLMENEAIALAKTLTQPEANNYLWGIPFAIKDNISTKDVPTCASSKILEGYIPIYNATVVDKLLKAKAVPIAKVTLDELAMGGTGATGHLGKTFNPYDKNHERMIGGSSCGSAAIVSAGVVPFSLGSDTGDSIRKPASYAGLVGLKPTWSRVSRYGLFPFAPSLDTVGVFTRCVKDAAILLNTLAGYDERDYTSSKREVIDYTAKLDNSIKGIKIAVIKEIVDAITDKTIVEKFYESLEVYKNLGATINFVHMDKQLLQTLFPTYYIISCAEATSNNANLDGIKFGPYYPSDNYVETIKTARSKGFSERIKRRFIIGSYSLMRENVEELYLRATKNRHNIVNVVNKILNENDVIFLPAAPNIAPKFTGESDSLQMEYFIADNFMVIGNFGGYPSITIPAGFKDGMPFGFNYMSKPFTDDDLLMIAKKLEDKLGLFNLSIRTKK